MRPEEYDAEELREKLKEYYGTAMVSGNPMAVIDLARIEHMNAEEIQREAQKNHIK